MELDPRYLEQLKGIHADGIITGNVAYEFRDTKGYDTVKTQRGTERLPYVLRQATLRLDFKVFDLRSGKLLAADSVSEPFEKKYGGAMDKLDDLKNTFEKWSKGDFSGDKVPLEGDTRDKLIDSVAFAMVGEITPTQKTCNFALARDSKNKMVKKGNEFAKRGVMESAKEMWEEALKQDSSSPAAIHNLGIYYEDRGDLDSLKQAEELYHKSTKLSDDTFYIDALARIKRSIEDIKKLEAQRRQKRKKSNLSGQKNAY